MSRASVCAASVNLREASLGSPSTTTRYLEPSSRISPLEERQSEFADMVARVDPFPAIYLRHLREPSAHLPTKKCNEVLG